jgi:TRAP-type C4-dicarboxylate transport system permease small subunit
MALAGGAVLLSMMLMTVADVVLRYGFNRPFEGSQEVTQFSMSLIVFLAIAHCGLVGGHISVDLFERALDRPSLRAIPALIAWAGAILFAVVAWRTGLEAIATTSKVSNMMFIPHYPFMLATAFGSAMLAVVLLIQGARSLRGRTQ